MRHSSGQNGIWIWKYYFWPKNDVEKRSMIFRLAIRLWTSGASRNWDYPHQNGHWQKCFFCCCNFCVLVKKLTIFVTIFFRIFWPSFQKERFRILYCGVCSYDKRNLSKMLSMFNFDQVTEGWTAHFLRLKYIREIIYFTLQITNYKIFFIVSYCGPFQKGGMEKLMAVKTAHSALKWY